MDRKRGYPGHLHDSDPIIATLTQQQGRMGAWSFTPSVTTALLLLLLCCPYKKWT